MEQQVSIKELQLGSRILTTQEDGLYLDGVNVVTSGFLNVLFDDSLTVPSVNAAQRRLYGNDGVVVALEWSNTGLFAPQGMSFGSSVGGSTYISNDGTIYLKGRFNPLQKTIQERGIAKQAWVAKRTDGVAGTGTAEDPFNGSSSALLQSIFSSVSEGTILVFADGEYIDTNILVAKSVTIKGSRGVHFTPAAGDHKPLFSVSGAQTTLVLEGVSLLHPVEHRVAGGWNAAILNHGLSHAFNKIVLRDVYSRDFGNTIWCEYAAGGTVDVQDCEFEYTHGHASITQEATFNHPIASVIGNFKNLIFSNNKWNGLVDNTFTGVPTSVPENLKAPADGPVQSASHKYCLIKGNVIKQYGIEGFHITTPPAEDHYWIITANDMTGADYDAVTYEAYSPAIKTWNGRVTITHNTIRNATRAISSTFTTQSEANKIQVAHNTIINSTMGIHVLGASSKSIFAYNTIINASEPVKTHYGDLAVATELTGMWINAGFVKNNMLLSEEPVFDATVTLLSRAGTYPNFTFTLNDASGLTPYTGILIGYQGGRVHYFPIGGIVGNVVSIDGNWGNAYPDFTSGTLYYSRAQANFNTVTAGIRVDGGVVNAEGNTIIGHRNDVIVVNGGILTSINTTTFNVHEITATSASNIRKGNFTTNGVTTSYSTTFANATSFTELYVGNNFDVDNDNFVHVRNAAGQSMIDGEDDSMACTSISVGRNNIVGGITLAAGTGVSKSTSLSSIATAIRSVTFPDAGGAVVLDTATQALTNKTLASPTITGTVNTNGPLVITTGGISNNITLTAGSAGSIILNSSAPGGVNVGNGRPITATSGTFGSLTMTASAITGGTGQNGVTLNGGTANNGGITLNAQGTDKNVTVTPSGTGNLVLTSGNLVLGTNSAITFAGTGAAATRANLGGVIGTAIYGFGGGGTDTKILKGNIANVTRTGPGHYTVTFIANEPDANYVVGISVDSDEFQWTSQHHSVLVSGFEVYIYGNEGGWGLNDPQNLSVTVSRLP